MSATAPPAQNPHQKVTCVDALLPRQFFLLTNENFSAKTGAFFQTVQNPPRPANEIVYGRLLRPLGSVWFLGGAGPSP